MKDGKDDAQMTPHERLQGAYTELLVTRQMMSRLTGKIQSKKFKGEYRESDIVLTEVKPLGLSDISILPKHEDAMAIRDWLCHLYGPAGNVPGWAKTSGQEGGE